MNNMLFNNYNIYLGNYAQYHGVPDASAPSVLSPADLDESSDDHLPQPPSYPYSGQLTQSIHDKTQQLLSLADEQVAASLDRKLPAPPPYNPQAAFHQQPQRGFSAPAPAINIDMSDRSWRMFNNESHVHHHHAVQENQEKDKDQTGLRILVGVIGLTVALATAFFLGKAVAGQEDEQDEKVNFDDLNTAWNSNQGLYPANYRSTVTRIVGKMESIYARKTTDRTHKFVLLTFALIAGGSAFAGALVASKVLMIAAVVIGGCTGAAALYKLGYSYFSKREQKDAEAIEKGLFELRALPSLVIYP